MRKLILCIFPLPFLLAACAEKTSLRIYYSPSADKINGSPVSADAKTNSPLLAGNLFLRVSADCAVSPMQANVIYEDKDAKTAILGNSGKNCRINLEKITADIKKIRKEKPSAVMFLYSACGNYSADLKNIQNIARLCAPDIIIFPSAENAPLSKIGAVSAVPVYKGLFGGTDRISAPLPSGYFSAGRKLEIVLSPVPSTCLKKERTRERSSARFKITTAQQDFPFDNSLNSPLGNLYADALRKWAKTDIAVIASDALNGALKKGVITEGDVRNSFVSGDNVSFVKIRGEDLAEFFEKLLAEKDRNFFVSGAEIFYSVPAPGALKVNKAAVRGKKISDNYIYKISLPSGIITEKESRHLFAHILEFIDTKESLADKILWGLRKEKFISPSRRDRWIKE